MRRSAGRPAAQGRGRPASRRSPAGSRSAGARRGRWVHRVTTVSTFPPRGLYTRDAETIARVMARPSVSPRGLGSAIRMVQFYINRGGRVLSARRRRELEKAKALLQERARRRAGRAGSA